MNCQACNASKATTSRDSGNIKMCRRCSAQYDRATVATSLLVKNWAKELLG